MNLTLYKKELKGSLKLLVIFAAVLTLYIVMIVDMFDPELADALKQFEQMMKVQKEDVVKAAQTLSLSLVYVLKGEGEA